MSRNRFRGLLAVLTACLALPVLPAVAALEPALGSPGCATPLLPEPARAGTVRKQARATFETAATRNGSGRAKFAAMTADKTLWLDTCGRAFYREPVVTPAEQTALAQAASGIEVTLPADADAFALESLPGALRTIYLDFDGEVVEQTAWNNTSGLDIGSEPFSFEDPVTDFSIAERNAIYRAWLVVAEDYAPFNVNVTTRDPGEDALDRIDLNDQTYGTRVLVTNGGSVFEACGCGGQAYYDVFTLPGPQHRYYQPAWVFGDGLGHDGWAVGHAASHEAGHNFGLDHDGRDGNSYDSGTAAWAPIMGASYYSTMSQWSAGEYDGATNTQDDLSIIATGAPVLADDHGNAATDATPLDIYAPATGVIERRSDTDAFTFTASGPTTVAVEAATDNSNLDVGLSIYRADGTRAAYVNPALVGGEAPSPVPAEQEASWNATLPSTPAVYTAVVDGDTNGVDYSDYGSLGRYRVTLDTVQADTQGDPLTVSGAGSATVVSGKPVSISPVTATGGTEPYTWAARNLPTGLTVDRASGHITGQTTDPVQGWQAQITVSDARGAAKTTSVIFTVLAEEDLRVPDQWFYVTATNLVEQPLVYSGANSTPTWTPAGTVPPGLTVTADGLLKGTPTTAGTYEFAVQAATEDSTASARVTVVVAPPPAPEPMTITTGSALPTGQAGDVYDTRLHAANAVGAASWAVVGGVLPPGLSLAAAADSSAAVVGTPTDPGTYGFRATVRDEDGQAVARDFTVKIAAPVKIATSSLAQGKVKRSYAATVKVRHATAGLTWKVKNGALPPGLRLVPSADAKSAVVRGKPTSKGTYRFRILVREADGDKTYRNYAIKVVTR